MKRPGDDGRVPAFTLVELLVVMAIVGVLASLLLPAAARMTGRARSTACRSNLHQIGIGLRLYLDDHGNRFPIMINRSRGALPVPTNSVEIVLGSRLGNRRVLRCPSDRSRFFEEVGSSYFWNFLLNGQHADGVRVLGVPVSGGGVPVFSDQDNFHAVLGPGRSKNHLYADGRVKHFFVLEPER